MGKLNGKLNRGYREIRETLSASITPFGACSAEEKELRRHRALTSLRDFAEAYFPHYLTAVPSRMHGDLYRRLQDIIPVRPKEDAGAAPPGAGGSGLRVACAAPRGNAKSTLASLILPLWCIAGGHRRFIGLLSDTSAQAEAFLEFIKAELEINDRLREDFPEACGEGRTWKIGHIITANGIQVKTWGKRKRLRGARHGSQRPDLIICDDLEDDENIDSPEQREKDRNWFFRAVMKMGAVDTVYIVVGTLLHHDSLLANLLQRPGWSGKKYRAVLRWSASPLWEEWETLFSRPSDDGAEGAADAFFAEHRREMLAGTEVLWPEMEDYYYLMKMRVSDGPAFFDAEKQNEPLNPADCLFPEEEFVFWGRTGDRPATDDSPAAEEGPVYCAVDPSMGKSSRRADPSAILIGAVRPSGHIDILTADIRKRHPDAIMEDLFRYHREYGFAGVAIESVQFQELFKDQVLREGARRGLYLPVVGVRPQTDKVLRISKLQPHIKNGLIRFHTSQRILLDQLKYFPRAAHDDGPDALEMLFSLISGGGLSPRLRRFN